MEIKNKITNKATRLILFVVMLLMGAFLFSATNIVNINTSTKNQVFASEQVAAELPEYVEYYCPISDFKTEQNLQDFATANNYEYYEQNGFYYFYDMFYLKTLVVDGVGDFSKYSNAKTFGTTTFITFDTIEETKQAYYELKADENLTVMVDKMMVAKTAEVGEYDASTDAYGWGYNAIYANTYNTYLSNYATVQEVVVVVVDTGINTSHEMFKNRIKTDTNGNLVGYAQVETTKTGATYDFEDDNGHGTHVSGIVCDTTPSNVKIIPIKIFDNTGQGTISTKSFSEIYSKIISWKNNDGYNIVAVNMSLGAELTGTDSSNKTFINSINSCATELLNNNILPVAAAGNDSKKLNSNYVPACCNDVITVSALTTSGSNYVFDTSYSNYGDVVDISAPGTSVESAYIGSSNSYAFLSGTSMATPYVSAATALLSIDPACATTPTSRDIENRLYGLAVDLGTTGKDAYYGNGMLSLQAAVSETELEKITYTSNLTLRKDEGEESYYYGFHYDGKAHLATITPNVENYTITYGLNEGVYNLTESDILSTRYSQFVDANDSIFKYDAKNEYGGCYEDNPTMVYFKITADGYAATYGSYKLRIYPYKVIFKTPGYEMKDISMYYGEDKPIINSNDFTVVEVADGQTIADLGTIEFWTLLDKNTGIGGTGIAYDSKYNLFVKISNTNYSGYSFANSKYPPFVMCTNNGSTDPGSGHVFGQAITVKKRPVSISFNKTSYSFEYGSYIKPDIKYIVGGMGFVNGDEFTLTYSGEELSKTSPAGSTQTISAKVSSNYELTSDPVTITITKRPVTLTFNSYTYAYGGTVPDIGSYKVGGSGFADNGEPTFTCTVNKSDFTSTTPAGTKATISATLDNDNYDLTLTEGTVEVLKRKVMVTLLEQAFKVGSDITLDINRYNVVGNSANGDNLAVVNGDVLITKLVTDATKESIAGNYYIKIAESNINYDITCLDGVLKITANPAYIYITNVESFVYGTNVADWIAAGNVTYYINGVTEGDEIPASELTFSCTAGADVPNVGVYQIVVTYTGTGYSLTTNQEGRITITARELTISYNKSFVYGESVELNISECNVEGEYYGAENINTLGLKLSCSAKQGYGVGKYNVNITRSNTNYNITVGSSYVTITARNITAVVGNYEKTYGNSINLKSIITVTFDNLYNNITPSSYTLTSGGSEVKASVGDYDVTLVVNDKNYNLTSYTKGKLTIIPCAVNITLSASFTYGDDRISEKIYPENELFSFVVVKTVSATGILDGDNIISYYTTNATNLSNVYSGEELIKYTLGVVTSSGNYEITVESGELTLKQRNITIQFSGSAGSEYGDPIDLRGITVTCAGVLERDKDNVVIEIQTTATSESSMGKYAITMRSCSNSNYNVSNKDTAKAIYTITGKNIFIKLLAQSVEYGEYNVDSTAFEIVANPNDETATIPTIDKLTLAVVLMSTAKTAANPYNYQPPVGTYKIYMYSATGDNKYIVNVVNTDNLLMTVTKRSITVTVLFSVEYGNDFGAKGVVNNAKFTDDSYRLLAGDSLNLSVVCEHFKNFDAITNRTDASDTVYKLKVLSANENYDVTLSGGSGVKVTPKNITIVIGNASSEYQEPLVDVTDLNNLAGNDFSQVLSGDDLNLTLATTATEGCSVNRYEIYVVSAGNKNYKVTVTNGVYTVTPKYIYISISDIHITYGDGLPENWGDGLATGVDKNGNDCDLSIFGIKLTSNVTKKTNVQNSGYAITPKLEFNNNNYSLKIAKKGYVIVEKRKVDVIVDAGITMTYGGESGTFNISNTIGSKYTIKNTVNDNVPTPYFTTNANIYSPVGTYSIDATIDNTNYELNSISGTFEIVAREASITIKQTGVYGDPGSVEGMTISNRTGVLKIGKEYEDLQISELIIKDAEDNALDISKLDVSTYTISEVVSGNKNYNITLKNSLYTIKRRTVVIKVGGLTVTYGKEANLNNVWLDTTVLVNGADDVNFIITSDYYVGAGITLEGDKGYPIAVRATQTRNNYNISAYDYTDAFIKVVPLPIQVKVANTIEYGEESAIADDYEVMSENKVLEGDLLDLKVKSTAERFSPVGGTYKVELLSNNPNYTVTLTDDSTTTVVPKKVTVRATQAYVVYLDEIIIDQKNTIDLSAIYPHDRDSFKYLITTDATKGKEVGEYTLYLTCEESDNPNYDVTVENGVLTITPKVVPIVVSEVTITYGDVVDPSVFDYEIMVQDETTKAILKVTLSTAAKQFDDVGEYAIKAVSGNKNYIVSGRDGKLVVKPAKIKIALSKQEKGHFTFTKPDQKAYKVVEGKLLNNDDPLVRIYSIESYWLWGEIGLTAKNDNPNYEIEFVDSTLTIKFSFVDTLIIVVFISIIVIIIVSIIVKKAKRVKDNEKAFKSAMSALNNSANGASDGKLNNTDANNRNNTGNNNPSGDNTPNSSNK